MIPHIVDLTDTRSDLPVRPMRCPPPWPGWNAHARSDTHYAVARTHFRVRVHVLAPWQHTFLRTCATGDSLLGTATAITARTCGLDLSQVRAALFTWLPLAVDSGLATGRDALDD